MLGRSDGISRSSLRSVPSGDSHGSLLAGDDDLLVGHRVEDQGAVFTVQRYYGKFLLPI